MIMSESIGEYTDINDLIPHPDNPRVNDHAVEELANSIKRFGFAAPIIARAEDKMIIAGHTRWKAAKHLNLDKVPVRYMNLNPVDAKLLMLADNKIGERADWDEDQLAKLFEELKDEDLSGLGWDEDEIFDYYDDPFESEYQEPVEAPEPVDSDFQFTLLKGNCLEKLKEIPDNSIDSVVTDPPYHLMSVVQRYGKKGSAPAQHGTDGLYQRQSAGFMGQQWDGVGEDGKCIAFNVDLWKECLRVLKPGGHMVAFSATRTVHPMGVAIANAGFEIRDMISWLYFSGFPKSHAIGKSIDKHLGAERETVGFKSAGIGTGDSYEKIVGKRKNIDTDQVAITKPATPEAQKWEGWGSALKPSYEPAILARKPLEKGMTLAENVLKHGTGGLNIDACRFAYGDPCWVGPQNEDLDRHRNGIGHILNIEQTETFYTTGHDLGRWPANIYQCPKASRSEREAGLEHLQGKAGFEAVDRNEGTAGLDNPRAGAGRTAEQVKNFHPTVKPIGVMRWLCRLITPPGGTVLDPFLGSGTTAVSACLEGNFHAIGCEMTEEYYPIIEGRIEWAKRERENGPKE
jgi:site-specific DNA-methyltransferase (adenine-specific)